MLASDQSLIRDIYEAAIIPEGWFQVLEQISAFAGTEGGSMSVVSGAGERSWVATDRFCPIMQDFYAGGWHLRNDWSDRAGQRQHLRFFDETEIYAPGELDSSPLYRDFIRPRGAGWSAGAIMQIPGGGHIAIRFERPYGDGPMSDELRIRLDRLRSHLARASLLFSRLGTRQARSVVSSLQFMDVPAAVLTRNGRLLACNSLMESRLSQIHVRAGDRVAFTDDNAQRVLSDSLRRITAGLFDQLRGPIRLPATEEHGPAVAYLVPICGAAQDLFGCEATLLMIRPAHSENRLMDLVRTRFAIDAGEAQRWARHIAAASPRMAAALLATTENVQAVLDRTLGRTQSRLESRVASFLWQLRHDPELSQAGRRVAFAS
ncbi:hypothetical protein [Microvirga splendida]|uniref:Helix-turn-helix transcriptional regulator n=1 Tax=Microvirga splendida TaxID=2795727 RepID=A0ABS0XXW1_9HYPH|nr:hypothetical protein [Microvirga splendida]MBJ6124876.1 hypothetical protein [Microvirga splendida]